MNTRMQKNLSRSLGISSNNPYDSAPIHKRASEVVQGETTQISDQTSGSGRGMSRTPGMEDKNQGYGKARSAGSKVGDDTDYGGQLPPAEIETNVPVNQNAGKSETTETSGMKDLSLPKTAGGSAYRRYFLKLVTS